MTSILDSRDAIKKYDLHNVLGSAEAFPDQITDAWAQIAQLKLPADYKDFHNVVVSGMGGSALGSHVIKHLFKESLTIPFEIFSSYELPRYADDHTLLILSSYSGTTEETLAAAEQALTSHCKIIVITAGGELAQFARAHNLPLYLINPSYNPSNQPRMAVGYSIFGQIGMLNQLGLIKVTSEEVASLVANLKQMVAKLLPEVENNPAKYLAYAAFDRTIIVSAAEHLIGAAHVTNNQLNENAKTMTAEWNIPELNHHYLEALSYPKIHENVFFLFINSYLYNPRISKRIQITKQLAESKGCSSEVIQVTAKTKFEQVFEVIQLGAFFNFYLAMLHKIDPAPIPTVDWFKAEMAK